MADASFMDNFCTLPSARLTELWSFWGSFNSNDYALDSTYVRPPNQQTFRYLTVTSNRGIFRPMPGGPAATVIFHFAHLFDRVTFNNWFFCLNDTGASGSTSMQFELRVDGAGHLQLTRNGTVLVTSTNTFSTNTWYTIEGKVTINNSTGAYEIRVNGTSTGWIPAATGANTRGATNNSAANYSFNNSTLGAITDFFIANPSSSSISDFIGPGRIAAIRPAAVGAHADWTPNFGTSLACVADIVADGDATFAQSSTANQIDTFVLDDLPAGSTIKAVQAMYEMRQDAGAQRQVATVVRDGGGTDRLKTTFNTASSHLVYPDMMEANPAGGAWTAADLNACEFGYKLVS